MAGYILKYSAGTYQRKISALEGYYSQLTAHLEELNNLHGKMKEFWDGSSAEYMALIGDKINEVKDRMNDCKNTNLQYQQIVDDLGNASGTVDSVVSDIKAATQEVADTTAKVASIAALIV